MNKSERDEIRERCEATTPPNTIYSTWKVFRHSEGYGQGYGETTFYVQMGGDSIKIGIGNDSQTCDIYNNYAEFIAHAREDVPKLLAELEQLESVHNAYVTGASRELSRLDADRDKWKARAEALERTGQSKAHIKCESCIHKNKPIHDTPCCACNLVMDNAVFSQYIHTNDRFKQKEGVQNE